MALARISLVFMLATMLSACAEKPPIPEEKFADFYIQLQFADAQYGKDALLQRQKVDSLMKAFDIDKVEVDSTMAWFDKRPDRWNEFFSRVQGRLAKLKPDYVKSRRP